MTAVVYKDSSQQTLESLSYTYDANGNRTGVSRLGVEPILPGITNSTYNNSLNRMDSFNGVTLTYDANGNLTHQGDMVLTWDARDRLVSIANSPGGNASFSYDAFDRRVQKTVDGVTRKYLYDGQDIVEERDGSGSLKAFYIRTLNIDEPLARIEPGGTIRYYLADALGSIIALVDDNEVVKTRYNYSPFGVTEIAGEASDNPFMYTGRELDGTGLYYYRARYNSPDMGRFISEDPIGFEAGDVNFYAYVKNNPLRYVDPEGKMSVVAGVIAVISVAGAVGVGYYCLNKCMDCNGDVENCQQKDPCDVSWPQKVGKCVQLCVTPTILWEYGVEPLGAAVKSAVEGVYHH